MNKIKLRYIFLYALMIAFVAPIRAGIQTDKYLFDGGYVRSNATTGNFSFFYYNKDHLGNNREVLDHRGAVRQVTSYYPFGAPYADDAAISGTDIQPYKYNGKELDLMHGLNTYDYGARQYYSILGRWDRIDPLCEKDPSINPYHYCHNNPVNKIDIDGIDDYFSTNGVFMYSSSEGSNVYVGNDLITNVSLTNKASRQAVANVMGYYAKEVGISYYARGGYPVGDSPKGTVGLSDFGKSSDVTLAHTSGDDIHINKHSYKIGSVLYDKYNIMSTLEHENYHKKAGHGKKGNLSASAHAEIYAKQINSATFSKTTQNYQQEIIGSFINFLKSAIEEGTSDIRINSLISDVNNTLQETERQIVYERNGGNNFDIYCK